jgi:hypothetical protein
LSEIIYRPRLNFIKGDISSIGARIEAIKRSHVDEDHPDGWASTDEIIEEGRSPESVFHRDITYDADEALRKCQHDEARLLMRCYEVVIVEKDQEPIVISPANVCVVRSDSSHVFMSTTAAMHDDDIRKQVLEEAIGLVRGAQKRLSSLQKVSPQIIKRFDELIALIEAEARKKAKRKPPKARPGE